MESGMKKIYRLGELFCGPGGIGLAAKLTQNKITLRTKFSPNKTI